MPSRFFYQGKYTNPGMIQADFNAPLSFPSAPSAEASLLNGRPR